MLEYCSWHCKISFGIFEIDGIQFMRHGRRTYFTFFGFLLEVFHGNISPDLTTKINKYIVDTFHCIESSRKIIVVFYLCSELLAVKSQRALYKFIRKFDPVCL